jgi:hypothetical protein
VPHLRPPAVGGARICTSFRILNTTPTPTHPFPQHRARVPD